MVVHCLLQCQIKNILENLSKTIALFPEVHIVRIDKDPQLVWKLRFYGAVTVYSMVFVIPFF